MQASATDQRWWKAPKGEAYKKTLQSAAEAEAELGDVFERHFRLECLYDPYSPEAAPKQDRVTENAIASNVDTVSAVIAAVDIRARFMTDGGDWEQQRRARHLEWYAEDLMTRYEVLERCRAAFKEAAKKGNGLVKVHNVLGQPRVEHVLIENVVVPPSECRDGREPRQLHQWDNIDADELAARYPKHADAIERARTTGRRRHYNSGSLLSNDVECLWSYRLPIGTKGEDGYIPGRMTLVFEGVDLEDKELDDDVFPFGHIVWVKRVTSFYGISGAERIMGIQRALNRRNWQIEKANDRIAAPIIAVRPADAGFATKSTRAGDIAVLRGEQPFVIPGVAVNAETYNSRKDLRESAQFEFGQTSMAVHGAKPAGIDSGVAMREYKDQTTQRFADQEKAFEQLILDTVWLVINCCKQLGAKAPKVMRRSRFGVKTLTWSKVDMGDVRLQMKAAANLNRTPAGRQQLVIEFAQAGIISTDQARRLMGHPDLESEISLYTAALELVEYDLDAIADGATVMPDPMGNLSMSQWRAQAEYQKWLVNRAPEARLEALRQYVVQSVAMLNMQAPANDMAAPMDEPMPDAGTVPAAPTSTPSAAFADQAMTLRAS
jgi:hypothetical protein